jgi:hypothetical protein
MGMEVSRYSDRDGEQDTASNNCKVVSKYVSMQLMTDNSNWHSYTDQPQISTDNSNIRIIGENGETADDFARATNFYRKTKPATRLVSRVIDRKGHNDTHPPTHYKSRYRPTRTNGKHQQPTPNLREKVSDRRWRWRYDDGGGIMTVEVSDRDGVGGGQRIENKTNRNLEKNIQQGNTFALLRIPTLPPCSATCHSMH